MYNMFKTALKYLSLMPQTVPSADQIWSLRTMKGIVNYMLKTGRRRVELFTIVHFVVLILK